MALSGSIIESFNSSLLRQKRFSCGHAPLPNFDSWQRKRNQRKRKCMRNEHKYTATHQITDFSINFFTAHETQNRNNNAKFICNQSHDSRGHSPFFFVPEDIALQSKLHKAISIVFRFAQDCDAQDPMKKCATRAPLWAPESTLPAAAEKSPDSTEFERSLCVSVRATCVCIAVVLLK